jgi:2-polyprenyl-3-methyl-5-hydroxy-6-metoxy-1,4-benzoquinol methylase
LGIEQGPDYYNGKLARMILPLEASPWKELYEKAFSLLPAPEHGPVIVDIGCGTGRFARLLSNNGYTEYWGVDFSEVRVNEARRYTPEFKFSVGNIFDHWVGEKIKNSNVFVLLEVLEHIDNDIDFLSSLPAGGYVIFSVPNYNSAAHVRFFKDVDDVIKRYNEVIDFSSGKILTIKRKRPGRMIYLFSCVKR